MPRITFPDLPALVAQHRKAATDARLPRTMRKLSARIVKNATSVLAWQKDPKSQKSKT